VAGYFDYISLTDIARYKDSYEINDLIRTWLRNPNTIEFLGIWEQLNNPDFNPVEFDGFRKKAGLNSFALTQNTADPRRVGDPAYRNDEGEEKDEFPI
jgi:hypothetical protein